MSFFVFLLSACATQKQLSIGGGLVPGDENLFVASDNGLIFNQIATESLQNEKASTELKQSSLEIPEIKKVETIVFHYDDTVVQEDTDEVKLKTHPFAIAGVALTGAAITAGVLVVTGPMISILWPLLLLGGGLTFATLGIKKIKQKPEIYKGEKLATAVYWAMIPIGLLLMILPIYLLFNF